VFGNNHKPAKVTSMPPRPTRSLVIASLSCCALLGAAAHAEPFSWQLGGGMSRSEPFSGGSHADATSLGATYYLAPVDDTNGPLALASFLNPTSRMSVDADRSKSEGFAYRIAGVAGSVENETDVYAVSGRYVLPQSRWYAGGAYTASYTNEAASIFGSGSDPDAYTLVAGKYLGAKTTFELVLGRSQQTRVIPSLCLRPGLFCTATTTTVETEARSVGLEAFHLWRGRSIAYSLSGGVSQSSMDIDYIRSPIAPTTSPFPPFIVVSPIGTVAGGVTTGFSDRGNIYRAAGEIFPTPRLGVRLGYSRTDDGGVFSDGAYDLAATWFFKPRVGVRFSYSRSMLDDLPDGHGSAIRFIGRL
jgi:hypothetical protein